MFRTLGEVLQTAVAQGMIDGLGELGVDAPARPPKGTGTNVAPAKFTGSRHTVAETTLQTAPTIGTDRRTGKHPQLGHAPAPLVRRSMLTVIEGGRETHEGGHRLPAFRRNSWRERARETGLVLVHSSLPEATRAQEQMQTKSHPARMR